MEPRAVVALTAEHLLSPSPSSSSISASTTTTPVINNFNTRVNSTSTVVEVSPLSHQSDRIWRGGSGRHLNAKAINSGRSPRITRGDSTSDINVTIPTPTLHQAHSSSPYAPPGRTAAGGAAMSPSARRASQEAVDDRKTMSDSLFMVRPCSSPLCRGTLSLPGVIANEPHLYLPPRCYHLERLVYMAIAVSIIFRTYHVGFAFFKEHMPQLRSGVGEPNRFLAAILPTIGYDGGLDRQWIGYNHSLPSLFLLAATLGFVTRLLHHTVHSNPISSPQSTPSRNARSTALWCSPNFVLTDRDAARLQVFFYLAVGVIFVAVLHGPHFFVPLLLILANYVVFSRLQRWCPYWAFMTIMWVTHISLLYIIELYAGFEDMYWMQYYLPTSIETTHKVLGPELARAGLWCPRMRWYIAFRMTTLRLIAFNYDLWEATHSAARARGWAIGKHDTTCIECAQLREQNSSAAAAPLPAEASRCYKYRTEYARDPGDYSVVNYLAYVVFPPLYLAGPMSSFNAFVSYMHVPSTAMPPYEMFVYAIRTGFLFLAAYIHLHFWFIIALSERIDLLMKSSPELQSYVLYHYLAYLWLKFSFIWKSSRLFAMFSGIEVPEDMRCCFSNTTTVRNFWRDWHASFNLWIVRYMYIPMGGRPRAALSILPIFLFIALWHDPTLHLLKWALCIAAMFVVEMAVSTCFGWVACAFRREMAVCGDDSPNAVERANSARPRRSSRRSVLAPCVHPVARWSARHLTPCQRGTVHRVLVTVGCFFSVFGLIVANMIGFCVQNTSAEVKEQSSTDALIWRALEMASARYYFWLVVGIYSATAMSVSVWMWKDVMARQLRAKYHLRANAPTQQDMTSP